jgi:hypothetical protein
MSKMSKKNKNDIPIKIDYVSNGFQTMMNEKHQTKEMVNHPEHYDMDDNTYEPYKVINAWKANFNIGNAIKYLARYKKKWNPIEDLQKAKQYIDFEIECLTKENDDK